MNAPTITLRQPLLTELRDYARQICRARVVTGAKNKPEIRDPLRAMTMGVMAEEIVAQYLCVDNPREIFDDPAQFAEDDDIYGIQVRSTDLANGHLITNDYDKHAPYAFVILNRVSHDEIIGTLAGWAMLDECNVPARWRTHGPNGKQLVRPAYFTPQSALHPIDTVPIPLQLKGQIT